MKNPIFTKDDNGDYRIMTADEVTDATKKHLARRVRRGTAMTSPEVVTDYLISTISEKDEEVFMVLFVDTRHRIIEFREMYKGTLDSCTVFIRPIIKAALELNAGAILCAHQHPSGNPEPSQSDIRLSARLKEACELVELRMLDSIVIAGGDSVSLASRGLL